MKTHLKKWLAGMSAVCMIFATVFGEGQAVLSSIGLGDAPVIKAQAAELTEETATVLDAVPQSDDSYESAPEELELSEENVYDENAEKITVNVHQQSYGTLPGVESGETAGRVGTGKRLEGFSISRVTAGEKLQGAISYRAYCQTYGWKEWKTEGEFAGTTGQSKRMEAIQIKLEGDLANEYDIAYRTYMSNCGWLGWTKNGQTAGTLGCAAVLEGIQVVLLKKNSGEQISVEKYAAITSEMLNDISYSGHVQTYGNTPDYRNGQTLGTTGKAKRLEAITINLSHGLNQMFGSLNYQVHCQTYGWMNSVTEGRRTGTTGEAKRLEAIRIQLSGDISKYCDVYYRVHSQRYGWLGWAKNGENAGTQGVAYRMEAIEIKLQLKGKAAPVNGNLKAFYNSTYENYQASISGAELLDPYLNAILAKCTTPEMTQEQKLQAIYDYIRTSYPYRTLSDYCPPNFKWYEYYAYQLVTTGSGNCFGFNSLMGLLAKKIGYTDVHFYKGSCFPRRYRHGFVTINGLFYDPELDFKGTRVYGATNGTPVIYYIDLMD